MTNEARTHEWEAKVKAEQAAALADNADTAAKVAVVAASALKAGVVAATPTGLAAFKIWVGVAATPLLIKLAPLFFAMLGAVTALSASIGLYAKTQRKKKRAD